MERKRLVSIWIEFQNPNKHGWLLKEAKLRLKFSWPLYFLNLWLACWKINNNNDNNLANLSENYDLYFFEITKNLQDIFVELMDYLFYTILFYFSPIPTSFLVTFFLFLLLCTMSLQDVDDHGFLQLPVTNYFLILTSVFVLSAIHSYNLVRVGPHCFHLLFLLSICLAGVRFSKPTFLINILTVSFWF